MKTKKEYFILKDENGVIPFAIIIVKNDSNIEEKIINAIKEEYTCSRVTLGSILFPDYGDTDFFNAQCIDEDNIIYTVIIQITNVVAY